jgi:hypothetical protein
MNLESLQDLGIFSYLRHASCAYPALLALHLIALIFAGGGVVLTNLCLLNLGMKHYQASHLVNGLRVPKRISFAVAAITGVLLFGAKAHQYSYNPWFWVKVGLLLLIAANYLVFRDVYTQDSGKAKLAAVFSLLLWTGVIGAARGPASIKDVMHSMVDPSGDFLFHSVQTISDEQGVREVAPRTEAEWEDVRQHLLVLQDAPDLLQGRKAARPRDRSKNPQVESEPEAIQKLLDADPSKFQGAARRLQDAASVALKAVDAKDKDTFLHALDGIDKACESCHLRYWYPNDKRAHEAAKEDGIVE